MKQLWESVKGVIAPALFLTFTFFVFGPLEIYMTNASNFFFDLRTLIVPIILCFIISFSIVLVINVILRNYTAVMALTFSIGLGIYLQGNWMQVDYGIMDGTPIDWSSFGSWGIINTVVWVLVLIIPVLLCFVLKQKKLYCSILTYISYGLVVMQCITLIVIMGTTDLKKNAVYLEDDAERYQLSQEKNIVVMLFDAFQAAYFQQAIDEIPEAREAFDGFTFFNNAVSTAMFSEEGGATIFTGKQMQADKNLVENVAYIYEQSAIFPALEQEGYDIRYYVSNKMVSPEMVGTIRNLKYDTTTANPLDLMQMMARITAFRYAPHNLKQNFWFSYDEIDALNRSETVDKFVVNDDIGFYNDIQDGAVTATLDEKAYRVYYFKGAHHPYNMTENVECIDYGKNWDDPPYVKDIHENEMLYGQVLGCVRIMMEYIQSLKDAGVYDQTTILITADHGWENRYNPMFLMKPENERGELIISQAPISYIADFEPTVLNAIGEQYTEEKTVFDFQEDEERYREIYIYEGINVADRSYEGITAYGTYGKADDLSGYFMKRTEDEIKYELGSQIVFTKEDDGRRYFQQGCSVIETDFCWSSSHESAMKLNVGEIQDDLRAEFSFKSIFNGSQRITIQAGERVLFDGNVVSAQPYLSFNIPKDCVQNGILELKLSYPDATSPKSLGISEDVRELAVGFSEIVIHADDGVQEETTPGTTLEKTARIDFSAGGNSTGYTGSGWHGQEEEGRWTSERAELTLLFHKGEYDTISVNARCYPASGATKVLLNDREIGMMQTSGTEAFSIPAEAVLDGEIQKLTFVTEGATSPKAVGESDDVRLLGLYVFQMELLSSSSQGS